MKTIVVSRQQVEAAKAVIEIEGGPHKVEPLIVRIAGAKPRREATSETPSTGRSD